MPDPPQQERKERHLPCNQPQHDILPERDVQGPQEAASHSHHFNPRPLSWMGLRAIQAEPEECAHPEAYRVGERTDPGHQVLLLPKSAQQQREGRSLRRHLLRTAARQRVELLDGRKASGRDQGHARRPHRDSGIHHVHRPDRAKEQRRHRKGVRVHDQEHQAVWLQPPQLPSGELFVCISPCNSSLSYKNRTSRPFRPRSSTRPWPS